MEDLSFRSWLEQNTVGTEEVDSRQLDAAYDKAKYAVRLVRLYDKMTNQKLLTNISTIATLSQGAFGLYNSGENKKVIGPAAAAKLRMRFGQDVMANNTLNRLPTVVIKQYVPDIDERQIQPSDVIHVNVQKHLAAHGDSMAAILEIASTIVHECTHELEMQATGRTSEAKPQAAERAFMTWVQKNWQTIRTQIPELTTLRFQSSGT